MIGTTEAAKKLNVTPRRVRALCEQGRIKGIERVGNTWTIPNKPIVLSAGRIRPSKIKMKKGK
jgi:hypothetical protein